MNTELIVFGLLALALGVGLLSVARRVYPRLDLSGESLSSIRQLTVMIAVVLLLMGIGLVVVGLFG